MIIKFNSLRAVATLTAAFMVSSVQAEEPCPPHSAHGLHHSGHCLHCLHHSAAYLHHPLSRAELSNWHANYAHSEYGAPIAMVVPPTAQLQTNWSWGAPSLSISRIDHQFGRNYNGPAPFGAGFRRTPVWPSSTHQFGVYHVRAPWYPTQR